MPERAPAKEGCIGSPGDLEHLVDAGPAPEQSALCAGLSGRARALATGTTPASLQASREKVAQAATTVDYWPTRLSYCTLTAPGAGVEAEIGAPRSASLEDLAQIAAARKVKDVPGITNLHVLPDIGKPEYRIRVDRTRAADLRLSVSTVANTGRLRPVPMTALVDALGLLTLALGLGEGTGLLKPMAIAVTGGLAYTEDGLGQSSQAP